VFRSQRSQGCAGSNPVLGTTKTPLNGGVFACLDATRTKSRTTSRTKIQSWVNMDFDMNNFPHPPYQAPFVYQGKEESFVSVSWFNRETGKYEREKIRLGIRGLPKPQKKVLLYELCAKLNEVIKIRNKNRIYHDENIFSFQEVLYPDNTVIAAFQQFKDDQENPEYQRDQARAFITRFTEFAADHPTVLKMNISMISTGIIKKYIQHLVALELTGKTINTHLWVLGKVMARITQSTGTAFNFEPEKLRVKQVKNETELYKPLSDEEKEKIFSYFKNHQEGYYQNYYRFLAFIYYTCIRPGEIMRLQLKHINLKDRTVYVPWYNAKNGLSKYVQILDPLYNVLAEMDLHRYHQDDHLFSHRFFPGGIKKTSKNVSELWLIAVKELDIVDRQMYGLKHTFNKDYVENNKKNIDWEWLRRHNRHATIQQTQEYISGLTAYFLDEKKSVILDHTK
jgi:integrase